MREWSDEGQAERDVAFTRIISELEELYPDEPSRQSIRILNPGCGLGRLVMELVIRGFWTQGNEISYHAIGIKFYIESQPVSSQPFDISVLSRSSHLVKRKYQTRGITIPDVAPFAVLSELKEKTPSIAYEELMSITAGSFLELYGPNKPSDTLNDPAAIELKNSSKDSFDVVVTNFLDTASNIIEYVRAINHVLKMVADG